MEDIKQEQAIPVHTITSENEDMIVVVRFKNESIAQALGEEIQKMGIQPVEGQFKIEAEALLDLIKK